MAGETPAGRGRLKVFLGYAAGVGKTFQMLTEGQDALARGIDVVVGYFEPHARTESIERLEGLEVIPRSVVDYRGSRLEEMDTGAILARRPRVALIDEFPHTNAPGSARAKRWEDVEVLRDAGIDVWTTMNVQHIESLNDQIWQISGILVRETVPDWVVQQAGQVVMVDLTPRALLNRLERGVVYAPERAKAALQNFFREPTLVALRELAMRQTAHAVETHLHEDDREQPGAPAPVVQAAERLLLVIEPHPACAALIRRGRRVADYLQAECFAVYVSAKPGDGNLSPEERATLEQQLNFARGLRIETRVVEGDDPAEALVTFARLHGVTQIFVMHPRQRPLAFLRGRGPVQRLVDRAKDMQVTIVADRSKGAPRP